MAMTSQKTLDLPLIPCGWSLFLMEPSTKQDLQLTFLKVKVKAYFGSCELLITCSCTRKIMTGYLKIFLNLYFTNTSSILPPAYFFTKEWRNISSASSCFLQVQIIILVLKHLWNISNLVKNGFFDVVLSNIKLNSIVTNGSFLLRFFSLF